MLDKKAVLTREKFKTICLTKKSFQIAISFIYSDNQELIHHINCFQYMFCHRNKTIKFC